MEVGIDNDQWRAIFESASESFVDLVEHIEPAQWDASGLGVWTLRDLVGHTSRALLTIEMCLARDAGGITLDSPVAYFVAARAASASSAGGEAIAQRGRDAGTALGPDPASAVRQIADRVTSLVDRTADDAPCSTPVGGITLAAYLPTRAYELTVHSLDIAAAIGAPTPEKLGEPITACLELLAAAIGETPLAPDVLLALAGRRGLPDQLHVI
ncbi:MAG: hypothetical protein JWO62_3308 [Acidimicrobiaceae bacterium]|nr:hypothetical protein [Acidimicrobiaceae bacterium]